MLNRNRFWVAAGLTTCMPDIDSPTWAIGYGLLGHGKVQRRKRSGCSSILDLQPLGLVRIEIVVAVGNFSSQRAAEKAGAYREGLLRNRITHRGEVGDAYMFSLVPSV